MDIRTIPHHENSWKYVEEYTFHPVWHVMGGRCPKKYMGSVALPGLLLDLGIVKMI